MSFILMVKVPTLLWAVGGSGAPLRCFLVEVGKFQNYGDGVGTPFGGHGL